MPLRKGDFIGAYEIVAPLGQGGMATVYKAHHARLNRFVAIKMIHPAYLQDESYLTRFQREAQIVAALDHPHIVPIYDFSEHEGEPYLVMKLIEGSTLKMQIAHIQPTVDDVLHVITPVASALDYAHRHGVLHRDIKPSNIMLDQQQTPYLTDFGLARLSVSGASTLSKDQMIGTPYYMSPEQGRGKGEVDHRADLYSLGVVLYELFVGAVPFNEGTPYAIIHDHIARELPLPHEVNPNVPPAIEAFLLRALAKDPDDRYQSAGEMVNALRGADAPGLSTNSQARKNGIARAAAVPSPTPTQLAKKTEPIAAPSRRSWRVEAVLGVIVVVLVVMLLGVLRSRNQLAVAATGTHAPTALAVQETAVPPTLAPTLTLAPPTLEPSPQRPQPTLPPRVNSPPPRLVPTVPMLDVPQLTAEEARRAILRDPNNPGPYLALARTQLQANTTVEDLAARQTLADGLSHFPDAVRFYMTAANLALEVGRYDAAFLIYADALKVAQGQPPYPAVRETAGQYLYNAATLADRLTLAQVRYLDQQIQDNPSPIVSAMIGRAFLNSGMPRLAEVGIDRALAADNTLAEAHLVNGELQFEQGDRTQALAEWKLAHDDPSAPQWVRDRADQLMNTLS
jgi:serine/threonine protein kinase